MITVKFQGPRLNKELCEKRDKVALDYLKRFPEALLKQMVEDELELFDLGSTRVECGEGAMHLVRSWVNEVVYNALGCENWYNPEAAPTVDTISVS